MQFLQPQKTFRYAKKGTFSISYKYELSLILSDTNSGKYSKDGRPH